MKEFILDASVVLKYLIGTEDSPYREIKEIIENDKYLKRTQSFINFEILNVLRYELKTSIQIEEFYSIYKSLGIEELEISKDLLLKAALIAKEIDVSVYDSSYHVLALTYNIIFLTADVKYFNKAKRLGNIELLK